MAPPMIPLAGALLIALSLPPGPGTADWEQPALRAERGEAEGRAGEEHYAVGLSAFRDKLYRAAAEGFRRYLAQEPGGRHAASARYLLAEAYRLAGERKEALAAYGEFIEKHPGSALLDEARLRRGALFFGESRFPEASRELEQVRSPEGRARVLYWLGRVRHGEGKYREAADLFRRALKEPLGGEERRLSLRGLAESSQAAGDHAEAARAFRDLLGEAKVPPGDPLWSKALRSHLSAGLCRREEAPFLAQVEREASPRFGAEGLYLLGRCLESMGEARRAVTHYLRLEGAHPRAPEAPWALYRAGTLLLEGGNLEEGLKRLFSFPERHPASPLAPRAILLAAQTLFRQKRHGEVVAALPPERVRPWPEPYGARALLLLSEALLELGRSREALDPLGEVLSRKGAPGERARAGYLLGLAHYRLGEWGEARRRWGEKMGEFPPSLREEALFLSLLAAAREGAREQAAALARSVLALPGLPPERRGRVSFELARALVELGKAGEAERVLGETLKGLPRGDLDRAARLLLAGLLNGGGKYAEGATLLREWLARYEGQEGEARALILLAQSELEGRRGREAAEVLERLLARHPRVREREEALLQLGRLYDNLGEHERALIHYRAYLDEVGSSKQGPLVSLRVGEILSERGKWEDAARAWERAAAGEGALSLQARYRLGELYLKRGEKVRALAAFAAVARSPAPGGDSWRRAAALRAGALEEEKGRWKEALVFYRLAAAGQGEGVEAERARERVRQIEDYLKALKGAQPGGGRKP